MRIVYNENGLKILAPAIDIDIQILADKDVPAGIYYRIINISELPLRETREAWEMHIDANNADGKGLTKEEFEAKYPEHKGMAVQ